MRMRFCINLIVLNSLFNRVRWPASVTVETVCYLLFSSDAQTPYDVNPVPVDHREASADGSWYTYSLTGDNRHLRVTRGGEITHWRFHSRQAGSASFQVWRPRPDLGPSQ